MTNYIRTIFIGDLFNLSFSFDSVKIWKTEIEEEQVDKNNYTQYNNVAIRVGYLSKAKGIGVDTPDRCNASFMNQEFSLIE